MTEDELIRNIAIDLVCPYNHTPTTPYEIGEVSRLIRFAKVVINSLTNSKEGMSLTGDGYERNDSLPR